MKSIQRDAIKTLCDGCSKAEPKIFTPPQTSFPGDQDRQNLISRRWSLPSPTDPVWWRSMHAISSYRGNRPTNKQTHPHIHTPTHRQDRLQYTAPPIARRVIIVFNLFVFRRVMYQHHFVFVSSIATILNSFFKIENRSLVCCHWH